jgi:hypothetical protein
MLRSVSWSRCAAASLLAFALCGLRAASAQDGVSPGMMEPVPEGADSGAMMGGDYGGSPMMGSPYQGGCSCGNGSCGSCDGGCYGGACDSGCYGGCPSDGGCCDSGYCDGGCMHSCRMPAYHQPFTYLYADWLDLHMGGGDVAHAQQQNGIGGAGTVPFGDIGTVDIGYNSGYRVGGGIACNACSGVAVDYTHFTSSSSDEVFAPNINGGAVGSLVHHPGAAITASAGPVDATYDVDFQLGDVVYRRLWLTGRRYAVNYQVGAEFGHLDQDFTQTGNFGGGQSGVINTSTDISFDGGGLKAGIDGEQRLCCGFFAYGKATAAALSGRFDSHYNMFNSTTETLLARSNWQDNRVIGQLDAELGVGWGHGCWRVSAGYLFSEWTNVVTTQSLIDAVQADNYNNVRDNITFDGLVSRIECCW